jgi:hypothetical protein
MIHALRLGFQRSYGRGSGNNSIFSKHYWHAPAHGELTGTLVPVGDGCRNVNKNLPLFGVLLIKNWFP